MTCQWIPGEPTADDSCKCGEAIEDSKPWCYCAAHLKKAYIRKPFEPKPFPAPRPELRSDFR